MDYTVHSGGAPQDVWSAVSNLFVDVFSAAPYLEDAEELSTIAEWRSDKMSRSSGRLVIATRAGLLVGFAFGHALHGDAPWASTLSQLPSGCADAVAALASPADALVVHELAVRDSERGQGVARRCLSLLRDRPERRTFVGVYDRAPAAIAMYRRWGLFDIGGVPISEGNLRVLTSPRTTWQSGQALLRSPCLRCHRRGSSLFTLEHRSR